MLFSCFCCVCGNSAFSRFPLQRKRWQWLLMLCMYQSDPKFVYKQSFALGKFFLQSTPNEFESPKAMAITLFPGREKLRTGTLRPKNLKDQLDLQLPSDPPSISLDAHVVKSDSTTVSLFCHVYLEEDVGTLLHCGDCMLKKVARHKPQSHMFGSLRIIFQWLRILEKILQNGLFVFFL